jgi:hypothetical protein
MPIHDWTRVKAGIFHDFHHSWITEIHRALNANVLPPDCYALAERMSGRISPDVFPDILAYQNEGAEVNSLGSFTPQMEMDFYVSKQATVVIRHSSNDKIVALVEIVSPGNKASRFALRTFVEKVANALYLGYHLLILDLQPPGPYDSQGIHGCIWEEIADDSYWAPADKPLTLAAYTIDTTTTAYVEPVAVGDTQPEMPLFLKTEGYVSVPLETTYQKAWQAVPLRWQRVLETPN